MTNKKAIKLLQSEEKLNGYLLPLTNKELKQISKPLHKALKRIKNTLSSFSNIYADHKAIKPDIDLVALNEDLLQGNKLYEDVCILITTQIKLGERYDKRTL